MDGLDILWLTPDKPEDISVGRARISRHLEAAGHAVELRGSTRETARDSLGDGDGFDVIVGTTRLGAFIATLVGRRHGLPVVVDHVDPIRQLERTRSAPVSAGVERLENLAFRLADHVCYVYPEEESRVATRASAATKTDLGVDYSRFAQADAAAVAAADDRLDGIDSNIAVYVGGLEPIYHVETMLRSATYLEDWTLVVAGAGSLEPAVSAAAADTENIEFLGLVPHETVPGYLQRADVGLSLVDDPHTLKVLEYGAAGLPVVQLAGRAESRFGGLVEYCADDPERVAAAIERAAAGAGGTALQRYVHRFDWERIAEDYRRAIESATE